MMRFVAIMTMLMAATLAACATTPPSPAPAFYVMRHLNTPAGERDPDLLPEGQRLAALLPARLAAHPPRTILVSDFRRTRQTAAAVAARWGLTPVTYNPADTPALVSQVRAAPGPVLIVGHSNTVPDIVEQLGGPRPAVLTHPDFGDLWIVAPGGATQRVRVAE
ncbi:histidine phosphatase family protein [Sphingosinicella sp.]|uniref:histidine phosphatase family protein n=1 Tax=Sphingosinicella sp. TaxID=1917971 RepID=UPI00403772AE